MNVTHATGSSSAGASRPVLTEIPANGNQSTVMSLQGNNTQVVVIWATAVTEMTSERSTLPFYPWESESYVIQDEVNFNLTSYKPNNSLIHDEIEWSRSKLGAFLAQIFITAETILGNFLVVLAVAMDKKLQTPFNYYIVNLALTDLNVGMSVMSLYTVYNLYGYFPFNKIACTYWVWSDYTMTFESVATLLAISIDRLWSVTWTLHYRNHNSGRKSALIIAATWLTVNVMWLPAFINDRLNHSYDPGECEWDPKLNTNTVIYVGVIGYYIPLMVMIFAYCRIFYVMRRRLNNITQSHPCHNPPVSVIAVEEGHSAHRGPNGRGDIKRHLEITRSRKEKRAFYTLGHIVLAFLICWVPFYLLFLIKPFKPTFFPAWYVEFSYWMAYLNSAINPLVYGIGNDDFRRAFKKILLCKTRSQIY